MVSNRGVKGWILTYSTRLCRVVFAGLNEQGRSSRVRRRLVLVLLIIVAVWSWITGAVQSNPLVKSSEPLVTLSRGSDDTEFNGKSDDIRIAYPDYATESHDTITAKMILVHFDVGGPCRSQCYKEVLACLDRCRSMRQEWNT